MTELESEQLKRRREFLAEVELLGLPWLQARSVPLYRLHRPTATGIPVADGTGVLLEIADEVFVLSAQHVLKRESCPG